MMLELFGNKAELIVQSINLLNIVNDNFFEKTTDIAEKIQFLEDHKIKLYQNIDYHLYD